MTSKPKDPIDELLKRSEREGRKDRADVARVIRKATARFAKLLKAHKAKTGKLKKKISGPVRRIPRWKFPEPPVLPLDAFLRAAEKKPKQTASKPTRRKRSKRQRHGPR